MTTAMGGDASQELNGGTQQGERLQGAASGLVDQATRTAEAQASTTMTKAGDALEQVAQAIRDAGNGLREQQPQIAGVADTAAQQVEGVSSYLREHDAREVVNSAQQWARQQPALVVGGGLALGLLVGRFLKSGASQGGQGGGTTDAYGTAGYASAYGTGYGDTGYGTATGGYADATGYASTGGTGAYGSTGYGADATLGTAGVGVAATSTLGDTGSAYDTGGTGLADDDFGAGGSTLTGDMAGTARESDIGDELGTTDSLAGRTDDVLGDEGLSGSDADRRG